MTVPSSISELAEHISSQAQPMPRPAQPTGYRMIWVKFRRAGIHRWPAAPPGTEYLRHPHRHIFHFRVWIEVHHDDREIEFHAFLSWLERQYDTGTLDLDHRSCEMLADELYDLIAKTYGGRDVWVEVSEDGENGCFIRYPCVHEIAAMKGDQL